MNENLIKKYWQRLKYKSRKFFKWIHFWRQRFFWQYKDNLNKKITKIKKNKWNKNSIFSSVDEKHYPPKSIFIEKSIENNPIWLLPLERYKMGLSFYNKNYEVNCIQRLFDIKEDELLNKVTQLEDKFKIKSALNQLKLNKNKKIELTNNNFLTILNLFNSFEKIFSNSINQKYNKKLKIKYWKIKDNFEELLDKDSFELIAIIESKVESKLRDKKYQTISFLRDIMTHYYNYIKQYSDSNSYIFYKKLRRIKYY